jgi:hypothetical protein
MTEPAPGPRATGLALAVIEPYLPRACHDSLLEVPPPTGAGSTGPGGTTCDALVVLSHDRPERLGFASDLARQLGCPLVVLSTRGREAAVVTALAARPRRPLIEILAVPHAEPIPARRLRLRCESMHGAVPLKYRDLSVKRNTALALARMRGWRDVLLLDDDIRDLSARDVRGAFASLTDQRGSWIASWRSAYYPDNSAVCHAGRRAGRKQGVFVGSGAMALRLDPSPPLFPPVYNEDWCFLFEPLSKRQVIVAGEVRQLRYDPFDAVADRGGREEFGDVLGEGLFHLLHAGHPLSTAERVDYWQDVVRARGAFIRQIGESLNGRSRRRHDLTAADRRTTLEALGCLSQALSRHDPEMPGELAAFVTCWQEDLLRWRDWFGDLPAVDRLADAVRVLGWAPGQLVELA